MIYETMQLILYNTSHYGRPHQVPAMQILRLQTKFPCKANLQYLKTCASCTQKRNEAAKKKRQEHSEKENTDIETRRPLRKDKSASSPPTLAWAEFIPLLKESAFELHTAVILDYETLDIPQESEDHCHILAQHLAKAVWDATDF